jgi:hypothetical protein
MNVNNSGFPFMVLIEQTTYMPPEDHGGRDLFYPSPPEDPGLQSWGGRALWLAVWEIVCSTAGPAGMDACGARATPKLSLLVEAGHSVRLACLVRREQPRNPLPVGMGRGQFGNYRPMGRSLLRG